MRALYPNERFFDQADGLSLLHAQADGSPPVPRILWQEEDCAITGTPFFVMSRMPGRAPPDSPEYNVRGWVVELPPQDRARLGRSSVEALATLHRLKVGPEYDFLRAHGRDGTPLSHVRWIENWYRATAVRRPVPMIEAALDRLRSAQFTALPESITWGDAKPGNLLFADDLSVSAMLDWETMAIGHAEADLGWWLMQQRRWSAEIDVSLPEGLPDREETIALYEARLGRKVCDLDLYELIAAVGLAVVVAGACERRIAWGQLAQDTDMAENNVVTRMIARLLGLPPIRVSDDYTRAIAATVAASHDADKASPAHTGR